MDLLFCCHRRSNTEDSTPPPGEINLATYNNRGPPLDPSDDRSAGSNDGQCSDGHQPELSTAVANRTTTSRTSSRGNTTKTTGQLHHLNWAHVSESELQSSITQASVSRTNLGTHVSRSSRQGERETDLKTAQPPAINSGKRNLVVMQEAAEPYSSDRSPEHQRKVACQGGQSIRSLRLNWTHSMGSII